MDDTVSVIAEKNILIHSTRIGHLIHKMTLTNPTLLIESTLANSSENPSQKKLKTKCLGQHKNKTNYY